MDEVSEQLDTRVAPDAGGGDVRTAFDSPPAFGGATEVAPGVWWAQLPLSSGVGHVNVYLLADEGGWSLVDTGTNGLECQAALQAVLKSPPFAARPVTRVIATHFHPDHLGAAGTFCAAGAEFWTSRLTWLFGRMFQLDDREPPHREHVQLAERAGMNGLALAAYRRRPASDFRRTVDPLPPSYVRLQDEQTLPIGGRTWTVRLGGGHAPEHVTLWSNDGLAITGDQILPHMATNLSLHPSDPNADPVAEWIASCERFVALGDDSALCLPGHQLPFIGAATRCRRLLASQESLLKRLLGGLARPMTATECLQHIYRRSPQPHEASAMLAEMMGFLNHLHQRRLIIRESTPDGRYLWLRGRSSAAESRFTPPRQPR